MKSKFNIIFNSALLIIYTIVSILLFAACNKEEEANPTPPAPAAVKIAEGYAKGADVKIEVWANEELFTGYNQLLFALYDSNSGKRITESHIRLNPVMHMKKKSHSCPKEDPNKTAVNELFTGFIFFTMPSNDKENWTLETQVHNLANHKFGTAVFDIKVAETVVPRKRVIRKDGAVYWLGYYFPEKMKAGVNTFEIVAFTKSKDNLSFIPAEKLTMKFSPEMPAMEHGSPGNENPSHSKGGRYRGKVNFTMTGDWRLNLDVFDGENTSLGKHFFDVTVK